MPESSEHRTSAAAPRTSGLRGRAFTLLILATVGSFAGYVLLLPIVPLWATRGGAGELGAGATTSVFMLTTVLTQLAMPWLLEHGGYRWTFAAGALLLAVPTPLFLLTADLGPLLAVSAVRGVGFGMFSVVGAALAARLVPTAEIGRAAGYYGLAVGLPNQLFLFSGVWLALNAGFGPVFWIATVAPVLGAAAAVGVWLTGGSGVGAAERGDPATGGGAHPTGPRLWLALAAPLVVMLALAAASSGIVTFLAIPLERAAWLASAALLGYGTAAVLFRWLAGALNDRAGRPVLLVPAAVAAAVGMALSAWAIWPAGAAWEGPGAAAGFAVVAGATLFGAGFGAAQNDTLVVMFRRSGPGGYGTASAAWNIGYDGGTGAGALALGLLAQSFGYGPAFLSSGLVVVACLPTALLLARRPVRH
ncbi:putative MFS family arabinose efflux permease [Murinocardiopsis flavida]|uniref:Putative MFS family arabinose efflux permease n=1 Tax=Murinocardiopsis flavida TaxID=645275 RepID=A0A2P8DJ18_9ACTN|nr:MFS transporter [Murinocardiopsis flavida]PSK97191.1 putative MFS family arabinose efflux permease [Murinocardiopsis flavida]